MLKAHEVEPFVAVPVAAHGIVVSLWVAVNVPASATLSAHVAENSPLA
jgi:hypothetical protein